MARRCKEGYNPRPMSKCPNRTKTLKVRVTEAEAEALASVARAAKCSLSQLVRRALVLEFARAELLEAVRAANADVSAA